MKIYVDDIPGLMEAARRFTASLGWEPEPQQQDVRPDFYKGISPLLPKWKRDQEYIERKKEWVRQQRLKELQQFDLKVLIWLAEREEEYRRNDIWQMFYMGVIRDPAKVYKKIADWNASLPPVGAWPTEACEMSDDVLDRGAHYLHINRDLLDDYEEIWAEEWPSLE